jgi:hypothetical protein
MEGSPDGSMLNLLSMVQKRPVMYVGAADGAPGVQLDRLEMLISGYSWAVRLHGVHDAGFDLLAAFSPYLETRFGWSLNRGPIRAIRDASQSDADAWEYFWRLLWEFRDTQQR